MFSSLVNENCDLYIWLILYILFQLMSLVGFYTFLYPPQTKFWGYIVILMSVRSFVRPSVRPSLPISNPLLL